MIVPLIATILHSAPIDCAAIADQPVAVRVSPMPPQAIGATPDPTPVAGTRPTATVGALRYSGYGVSIRSDDPRFATIVVTPDKGLHQPCGYAIEGGSVWDPPKEANVPGALRLVVHPGDWLGPGSRTGEIPVLRGYRPGPTWPLSTSDGEVMIGLMYPAGYARRTLVVAFAKEDEAKQTTILADLPLRFQSLSAVPYMHGPGTALYLDGRAPDGTITRIVLDVTGEERERLGTMLGHRRQR